MDLVIGGSGFIGSHLVRELMRCGKKVMVYDRRPFPQDEKVMPNEMVLGDILDFQMLCTAMERCGKVFHLAAIPLLWHRARGIFERINHQGTVNVLQAAKETNIQRLIYTSTESILSSRRHNGLINEDSQPRLSDMIGPYCRSKFLAEQAVLKYAAKGFPAIVVNPTMPIGPGDRNLTPPGRMIADFIQGKIPGYINCTLNFVDVRDVALGHLLAAEKGLSGRRHILSGYNLTLAEFFSHLAQTIGRPAPRFQIPYFAALAWSYIEEWTGKITGRVPQSSVAGIKLCRRSLAFDGSKTWKLLGHTPRPVEESICDAVAWHQKRLSGASRNYI